MNKIKYVTAKDNDALNVIQDKAIKSAHSARLNIQIALVATVIHIGKHGDYTCASRLVEGLGNSVNSAAVVEWLVQFGGLVVSKEANGFNGWSGTDYIKEKLDDAKATMWYDLKKVNPFKGYNAEQELLNYLKRYKGMLDKLGEMPQEDAEKVNTVISDNTIQLVLKTLNPKFETIDRDLQDEEMVCLSNTVDIPSQTTGPILHDVAPAAAAA